MLRSCLDPTGFPKQHAPEARRQIGQRARSQGSREPKVWRSSAPYWDMTLETRFSVIPKPVRSEECSADPKPLDQLRHPVKILSRSLQVAVETPHIPHESMVEEHASQAVPAQVSNRPQSFCKARVCFELLHQNGRS